MPSPALLAVILFVQISLVSFEYQSARILLHLWHLTYIMSINNSIYICDLVVVCLKYSYHFDFRGKEFLYNVSIFAIVIFINNMRYF